MYWVPRALTNEGGVGEGLAQAYKTDRLLGLGMLLGLVVGQWCWGGDVADVGFGNVGALGRLQIRGGGRWKTGSKGPALFAPLKLVRNGCLEMEGGEPDMATFLVQSLS